MDAAALRAEAEARKRAKKANLKRWTGKGAAGMPRDPPDVVEAARRLLIKARKRGVEVRNDEGWRQATASWVAFGLIFIVGGRAQALSFPRVRGLTAWFRFFFSSSLASYVSFAYHAAGFTRCLRLSQPLKGVP